MNKLNRRKFLRNSTLAAAGTLMLPSFLRGTTRREMLAEGEKILVVLQLSGGNDSLNTVVPFGNDLYYQNRPQIGIQPDNVEKLDDFSGFHPSMTAMADLFREGELSIVQGVGYPNPDRSHFRSMDIWHTASGSEEYLSTGWLGRYLDQNTASDAGAHQAIEMGGGLSLAMKGVSRSGLAVEDPTRLYQLTRDPLLSRLSAHASDHDRVAYLYKTLADTQQSAAYLYEKAETAVTEGDYPQNPLAKQMNKVAGLIAAGVPTRVYYLNLPGFDTHVNQPNAQQRLLGMLSESLGAFARDLKKKGVWDRTAVMVFSEFGRRVKENGSRGTDHGTAGNVFLAGGGLKRPGFVGQRPDLSDLDKGDLKFRIDFREVYADLLRSWLGVREDAVIGAGFEGLGLV